MLVSSFEFSVLINGSPVKEYGHNGNTYIEGREGSEFSLKVQNNSFKRILAVISVDGKSIVNGDPCDLYKSEGYIVDPFGHVVIPGWRLTSESVAKFSFSKPNNSYAVKMGEGKNNLGVIGCGIFTEVDMPISIWSTYTIPCSYNYKTTVTCNADSLDGYHATTLTDNASYSTQNLGTGFGKEHSHRVTNVEFKRKDNPEAVMTIYYDNRDGLKAKGVNLAPIAQVSANPFPGTKYCQPPSGWKG